MTLDPRRIVLLGCSHGRMSEQLLHRAYVGAVLQQTTRERIAKAMRRGVDARDLAQALNGAPQVTNDGRGFAAAGPEKVLGIVGGQTGKLVGYRCGELHLQRNARLLRTKREAIVSRQGASTENGGVRPAKAGMQQQQNEGPGQASDVTDLGGIIAGNLIARGQQPVNLVLAIGHGGNLIDARRTNACSGVLTDEFSPDAPAEEEAEMFQFLSLCRWSDLPFCAPCGDVCRGDMIKAHRGEGSEGSPVAGDSGSADVARLAISKVACRGFSHGEAARCGRGLANLDGHEAANRLVPVVRSERAADGSADSHSPVAPNGAGTERVVLPLPAEFAASQMPAVGGQHPANRIAFVRGFCEIVYTGHGTRINIEFFWRKLVGVGIAGFRLFNNFNSLRMPKSSASATKPHCLYAAYMALRSMRKPHVHSPLRPAAIAQ